MIIASDDDQSFKQKVLPFDNIKVLLPFIYLIPKPPSYNTQKVSNYSINPMDNSHSLHPQDTLESTDNPYAP